MDRAQARHRSIPAPQFSFTREQRRVSAFYVYIFDQQMGPGFIKICTYFPYQVKARVNGHEWARQQARKIGLGFTELSNGFAACEDPALLQRICDGFGPGHVQAWFERWMARIPLPLDDADRAAGFWRELSMRQVETSRTLVFDDDVHARAFFEALLCDNMDLGRPENVELLFRRGQPLGRPTLPPPRGGFKTAIDRHCELVTLNVFYKNSRLKQYLKDGVALRIETVINDPKDLRCNRRLPNLPELQHKARAINPGPRPRPARLYAVEVEPEVRSWLEQLSDRDFGRADFLVGLLAGQAETLGEPYTRHLGGKYASCGSTCWRSSRASPTGSHPAAASSC